ncbi:MAG: hypothetical protein ACJ711_15715, partial [Ornithinibacter sp.]
MGFLDKLRGRDDSPTPTPDDDPDAVSGAGAGDASNGIDAVEEIGTRRLTAEEEAALETARTGYAGHGIDPADLDSIAAAYDRALEEYVDGDSSAVVEVIGSAIGDHLVAAGGYRWVVATDPFGTDL